MATTQAHAFLGVEGISHTFRFNPDAVNWGYQENVTSQDTIGGRVVQLLSVQVQDITVEGRAGSRGELQRLAENVRDIMAFHVRTSRPVSFRVPSRNWNFIVYVKAMPQIGWDVSSTSYPYSLQLAVVEDLTGIKSQQLELAVLRRLTKDIGYQEEFHGGDVKGFQKIVNSVLKVSSSTMSSILPSGVPYDGQGTDAIKQVIGVLKAIPGITYGGLCATSGHIENSEHYQCNAVDVFGGESLLDRTFEQFLAAAKSNELQIHCLIYELQIYSRESNFVKRIYDVPSGGSTHENHIHISGWPTVGGGC